MCPKKYVCVRIVRIAYVFVRIFVRICVRIAYVSYVSYVFCTYFLPESCRRKEYVRYVRIRTIRTQYVRNTYANTYEYVRIRTNTYIFTPTGFRRAQPYFFRPCTYSYVLLYVFRTYLYILKTKRVRICMYCETIFSPTCPVQSD